MAEYCKHCGVQEVNSTSAVCSCHLIGVTTTNNDVGGDTYYVNVEDPRDNEIAKLRSTIDLLNMKYKSLYDAVEYELDHADQCECDICLNMVTFEPMNNG